MSKAMEDWRCSELQRLYREVVTGSQRIGSEGDAILTANVLRRMADELDPRRVEDLRGFRYVEEVKRLIRFRPNG